MNDIITLNGFKRLYERLKPPVLVEPIVLSDLAFDIYLIAPLICFINLFINGPKNRLVRMDNILTSISISSVYSISLPYNIIIYKSRKLAFL